jgi:hypothetical protein
MGNDLYQTAVLKDAPVNYWRLDDAAGSASVVDLGSSPVNGTVEGGVTLGEPSGVFSDPLTTSALFNGSSGYIFASGAGAFTAADFTIEFLAQSFNVTGQSGNVAVSVGDASANVAAVFFNGDGSTITCVYNGSGPSSYGTGEPGQWHHVAAVFSFSSGNISSFTMYLDGSDVGTFSVSSPPAAVAGTSVMIGAGDNGGPANAFFDGYISDVAIYPTALSAAQVLHHYRASQGVLYNGEIPPNAASLVGITNGTPYTGVLSGTISPPASGSAYLIPPYGETWCIQELTPDANISAVALSDGTNDGPALALPLRGGRLILAQQGLWLKMTSGATPGNCLFVGQKMD